MPTRKPLPKDARLRNNRINPVRQQSTPAQHLGPTQRGGAWLPWANRMRRRTRCKSKTEQRAESGNPFCLFSRSASPVFPCVSSARIRITTIVSRSASVSAPKYFSISIFRLRLAVTIARLGPICHLLKKENRLIQHSKNTGETLRSVSARALLEVATQSRLALPQKMADRDRCRSGHSSLLTDRRQLRMSAARNDPLRCSAR